MFDFLNPRTPSGSPLDPRLADVPQGALTAPQAYSAPMPALGAREGPSGPLADPQGGMLRQLPKPEVKRKRLNMWDKEHIGATLAEISRGFMSGGNVLQGLAAAGQNVAGLADQYHKAAKGSTEVGGPDNAFEITTDENGNRTYTPIAAVTDYLAGKKKRDNAPKPKETADYIGDMSYSIEQLDEAQRPGAYQLMLEQAAAAGHDVSGAPPEYSPAFSQAMIQRTIGARQGSANEALRLNRAEINADRDRSWEASNARAEAASGRAAAAGGRAAEKHRKSMRSAPPSKRRGTSDLDYLR